MENLSDPVIKILLAALVVNIFLVFRGNDIVPADLESAKIWEKLGITPDHIVYLGEEDNWWPNMELTGPCGPDTEIFYFRSDEDIPEVFDTEDDRWVEIWNDVFMQYNKDENGKVVGTGDYWGSYYVPYDGTLTINWNHREYLKYNFITSEYTFNVRSAHQLDVVVYNSGAGYCSIIVGGSVVASFEHDDY